MNIYEKLLGIQSELKAPKSQYNDFGKYKYRNCEDILEAIKPLCAKYKAVLMLNDDIDVYEGRHYVVAMATLVNTEKPEEVITTHAFAREEENKKGMDASQITGATSSYARKYALNALFCIDDTKDSDATNKGPSDQENEAPKVEHCECCGIPIVPTTYQGKKYSVKTILKGSQDKFGKIMCMECMSKANET